MVLIYIHPPPCGFRGAPANPFITVKAVASTPTTTVPTNTTSYHSNAGRRYEDHNFLDENGVPLDDPYEEENHGHRREDYPFFCDPCQKGYHSEPKFRAHLADHIWCDVPGCRFTCKKEKAWKMEMHKMSLHERPDAPDLTDVDKYVAARKNKFPTGEKVLKKVEELHYRAARGDIIESEQRRWLRTQGVRVRRDPTTTSDGKHLPRQQRVSSDPLSDSAIQSNALPPISMLRGKARVTAMVQQVRDRYQNMKHPPTYYVCHRCGEKGQHWSHECPTNGDETFDKKFVPAFDRAVVRRGRRSGSSSDGDKSSRASSRSPSEASSRASSCTSQKEPTATKVDGDDGIERPKPVKRLREVDNETEDKKPDNDTNHHDNKSTLGRGALERGRGGGRGRGGVRGGGAQMDQPPPGLRGQYRPYGFARRRMAPPRRGQSLFERLTQPDRLDEMGLVLQALRYFTATQFLTAPAPWESLPDDKSF
eukprot:PhM_4_TR17792/c0_g1_i1/m.76318